MLFGRGAFDLARRVRRAVSDAELGALPRLLSDAEKQKLEFKWYTPFGDVPKNTCL